MHEHILRGETPLGAWLVKSTDEHILLHCVSFTNFRVDFSCASVNCISELFSNVASQSIIYVIEETGFIVKLNNFHSGFYHLHIICVYPIFQYLHCSYVLNLSVLHHFSTTRLFQIVFNMSHLFYFNYYWH